MIYWATRTSGLLFPMLDSIVLYESAYHGVPLVAGRNVHRIGRSRPGDVIQGDKAPQHHEIADSQRSQRPESHEKKNHNLSSSSETARVSWRQTMLGEECERHCKNDNRLLASLRPFTFKEMRETAIESNRTEDEAIIRGGNWITFYPS